ncbi:sensor histidine kinase [Methylopila henanensis]|uniref:histidine kinase n=1 Tax=Methylopila henanensis TaxID=873516 RepID=A0ABW4K8S9_9HYPH
MTGRSLRLRLSLAAAGLIALALVLGGAGLFLIFDAALDRRTADELDQTARFLAGQVAFGADGAMTLEQRPADPRYAAPYGGLYWQVDAADGQRLRSRSLWDKALDAEPRPGGDGAEPQTLDIAGPDGGTLLAVARAVQVSEPRPQVTILVGLDRRQLAASRTEVMRLLAPTLAALAVALSLAMALFVHRALLPFRALRDDLGGLREGRTTTLPGRYADEVQPLVDDLNALLDQRARALKRAETQAADMAHGLKTPLAVLSALGRRIALQAPAEAAEIERQAEAMSAQVTRALARARATAAGLERRGAVSGVSIRQIAAALDRLPGSERLDWRIETPDTVVFPASEGELFEILGALMDNARKWGRRSIVVSAHGNRDTGAITVADDGPGMPADERARIGRGVRWDETTPGTGFGLAIARDLAEAAGARLTLGVSELGGLEAKVSWPAPAAD